MLQKTKCDVCPDFIKIISIMVTSDKQNNKFGKIKIDDY